ncbi:MAG TPA: VOC family protein [Ktedonobacteraceae bacterium]|jgi:catechol 2,3-dioxygenase-like lactoylglutathione lyase family enzyme
MEFLGTRLLTRDFSAAIHFWRDIMGLPLHMQDESLGYAYFDLGKVGLEIMAHSAFAAATGESSPPRETIGRQVVLDFRVDDVDAAYASLIALGATPLAPPVDRPLWRARTAHLADPDGHVVELYTTLPDPGPPTA